MFIATCENQGAIKAKRIKRFLERDKLGKFIPRFAEKTEKQ